MPLRLAIDGVQQIGEGVWRASLSLGDIGAFNQRDARAASHTVIGASEADYNPETGTLTLERASSVVMASGVSEGAIIVRLGEISVAHHNPDGQRPHAVEASGHFASGSESLQRFFAECTRHELSSELLDAIERLLIEAYKTKVFTLIEGKQRKWTASPNFLALTIQNKKRQLLVSVKGDPSKMGYTSIKPKVSRSPYCEFHFSNAGQLSETLDAVRRSTIY